MIGRAAAIFAVVGFVLILAAIWAGTTATVAAKLGLTGFALLGVGGMLGLWAAEDL